MRERENKRSAIVGIVKNERRKLIWREDTFVSDRETNLPKIKSQDESGIPSQKRALKLIKTRVFIPYLDT